MASRPTSRPRPWRCRAPLRRSTAFGAAPRAMLTPSVLDLDCAAEVERICRWMVQIVGQQLHRRGVVLGLSGGVDSSVCGALAVRALGPRKVFGLLMPEQDSSSSAERLGVRVAEQWGIAHQVENIAPTLQ